MAGKAGSMLRMCHAVARPDGSDKTVHSVRRIYCVVLGALLFAPLICHAARFDVGTTAMKSLGEIAIPAEIVGKLQNKDGEQIVEFTPKSTEADAPVAIYTYTDTSAVFQGMIRRDEDESPVLF